MFTRALLKRTMFTRAGGSARSAGLSNFSKASRRQPGSFLKGRWFRSASNWAMARLSSPRLKKRRLRSRARIHRWTICTATSTFGLSFGRAGRGGGLGGGGGVWGGREGGGSAADELQRVDDRGDPVGGRLRHGGAGIGVAGGTQGRHEDLCLANLAGGRVHDRHGVAGVVDEELVAGDVGLSHRALQAQHPGAVLDAKAGVLVGQRVGL